MEDFFKVTSSLDPSALAAGRVRVDGLSETLEAIQSAIQQTVTVSAATGKKLAFTILDLAQGFVPYDTGALHDSGRVTDGGGTPLGSGEVEHVMVRSAYGMKSMIEYLVMFGDEAAYYALLVHENVNQVQWQQGRGPKPGVGKIDQYLAVAHDLVSPRITPTLANAVFDAWRQECAKQRSTIAAIAAPRSMAPRLVKRP